MTRLVSCDCRFATITGYDIACAFHAASAYLGDSPVLVIKRAAQDAVELVPADPTPATYLRMEVGEHECGAQGIEPILRDCLERGFARDN